MSDCPRVHASDQSPTSSVAGAIAAFTFPTTKRRAAPVESNVGAAAISATKATTGASAHSRIRRPRRRGRAVCALTGFEKSIRSLLSPTIPKDGAGGGAPGPPAARALTGWASRGAPRG